MSNAVLRHQRNDNFEGNGAVIWASDEQ